MEVVNGTINKRDFTKALRFLRNFPVEHPIANDYFWVMHQFAQYHLSHHIDMQDVMIASVAVRLQIPVYTLNMKHYKPLPVLLALILHRSNFYVFQCDVQTYRAV